MKTLRRIWAATVLSLIVAVTTSAGDIHSPGAVSTGTDTTSVTTTIILTVVSLIYR